MDKVVWCSCEMEEIEPGRLALGYTTCLTCGAQNATKESEAKARRIAPAYAKGAYQYITDGTKLEDLG